MQNIISGIYNIVFSGDENMSHDRYRGHGKSFSGGDDTLANEAFTHTQNFQGSNTHNFNTMASHTTGTQPFVLPEPIRALSHGGLITKEEEELARTFYHDVCESGLMPRLMKYANAPVYRHHENKGPQNKELANRIRGLFALLDAVDDRLLATICALILEISNNDDHRPLNIEEVGRRVMGYNNADANLGAGGTLLRAALWMLRFGYNNPTICTAMMHEKQMKLKHARQQTKS